MKLTAKQDNSPILKKGEIKKILIEVAGEILPDFNFLAYKNNCYYFLRLRKADSLTVHELLHITFTLKENNFDCSVASTLNPTYNFSSQYNAGLLNPHKDLKTLKHNSNVLDIQNAYYFHNGQVETTINVVNEIYRDYKKYGLPFLDKQIEELNSNLIIKCGLDFIANLQADKEKLRSEITEKLKNGGFQISSIKHPTYIDLKSKMQAVGGQSRQDRQKIPMTAYELLEIYWAQ